MLSKKLGIVFALSPILGIYMVGIPVLSLSQILLLGISLLCLITQRKHIKVYFASFMSYAVVISVIRLTESWVIFNDGLHDILSLLLFFFILFTTVTYADYDTFKRTIINLGIISLSVLIIQYLLSLLGIRFSGIIPFLPLSNEVPTSEFIAQQLGRDRLSGLFQEPAHYSEFMIIILAYVLFSREQSIKSIVLAVAISATILLTGSATGLAMIGVVWIFWAFVYYLQYSKHKVLYLVLMSMFFALIIVILARNDVIMSMVARFGELSGDAGSEHGRSSYIRVIRGYIPFMECDLNYKILGNGLGNLLGYINSHPETNFLLLSDFNPKWINGVQYLLFTTGLFGAILYLWQILRLYFRTTALGKVLIICLILMFLSSDSFFSVGLLLYIVIKESINTKKQQYDFYNSSSI